MEPLDADRTEETRAGGSLSGGAPPASRFTVLVVDDQPELLQVIKATLSSQGHRVECARDGEEAWELYQQLHPHLVVSDIKMPGADGLELLERIRRVSTQTEVVLVTGYADTELVIRALRLGASNFVEKPFRPPQLLQQLEPSFIRCALALEAERLEEELERERRRQELDGRMATMGRLLAGLAHEVHNPLTFLKGGVELVEFLVERLAAGEASKLPNLRQHLADVAFGVRRIEELVGALRRFGAPGAHEKVCTSLAGLLENSLKLAQPSRPASVELELEDFPADVWVKTSAVDLESCFVNLLVNAYEALEGAGGGRVRVAVERLPFSGGAGDEVAEVSVADDGPGIPPGLVDEVFTPFFTRKEGGTGLGLSIAYEAAKRNGAEIAIHSEAGGGTRVAVRLPYVRGPGGERVAEASGQAKSEAVDAGEGSCS